MKRIEAHLHHIRVEAVVQALAEAGFRNLCLYDVRGMLRPITARETDYSGELGGLVISEICLSLVVEESDCEPVAALIQAVGEVGTQVSGHIYVSPVDQALQIGGPRP